MVDDLEGIRSSSEVIHRCLRNESQDTITMSTMENPPDQA